MDHRVQQIIALIEQNFQQELLVEELAHAVNLTPEHLCRVFKTNTSLTPAKYLKRIRMQKAQELLATTSLNVKEIMLRVGLRDESHFRRDFKMVAGLTPAQYRAHCFGLHLSNDLLARRDIKIGH